MRRKDSTVTFSHIFQQVFLVSALISFWGPLLHAQEIGIWVLNARNGKPITNECVNVSVGAWHGADIVAATNKQGIAVIHFTDDELVAEIACSGWPARASRQVSVTTIAVSGDRYVVCQEYGKAIPGEPVTSKLVQEGIPVYPIKEILKLGIAAGNTCGKFRAVAKPGELILFARSRSFWERLRE